MREAPRLYSSGHQPRSADRVLLDLGVSVPEHRYTFQVRERLRSFLRYCYEAEWLEQIPALPKIKVEQPPTMPLTEGEYNRLLDALYVTNPRRWDGKLSSRGLTELTHGLWSVDYQDSRFISEHASYSVC